MFLPAQSMRVIHAQLDFHRQRGTGQHIALKSCHIHTAGTHRCTKPSHHGIDQTTKRPNNHAYATLKQARKQGHGNASRSIIACALSAIALIASMLSSSFTSGPDMPPPIFGYGNTSTVTVSVDVAYSTGGGFSTVTYSIPPGNGTYNLPAGATTINSVTLTCAGITCNCANSCRGDDCGVCWSIGPIPGSTCSDGYGIKVGPSPC